MRAVVIANESLSIVERDDPVPGPGDALIEVHSAGLNAADLLQRRGFYPAPAGWPPDVPGLELAGVVSAIGSNVTSVAPGQRVCAIVGGGAQATHCVVPAEHLIAVPDGVDIVAAGGFAEAFTTAYDALIRQAELRAGERVLISGAAGGVGTAAVQIARAWGAVAIAATRDSRHHSHLRDLGATETVTVEEVATLEPVDVVIELVGAAHLQHAQRVLAPRARVVVIGVGGGGRVEIDLLNVMAKRATLTGSTLRARSREEKAQIAAAVTTDLVGLWSSDQLRVPIAGTFDIGEVNTAYDAFATAGKFGKIILTTN